MNNQFAIPCPSSYNLLTEVINSALKNTTTILAVLSLALVILIAYKIRKYKTVKLRSVKIAFGILIVLVIGILINRQVIWEIATRIPSVIECQLDK